MQLEEEYDSIISRMTRAGGVSIERIRAAEAEMGVIFPDDYRKFLVEHGAAVGDGREFAGLFESESPDEPPRWVDVVRATQGARRISAQGLPRSLVLIADDGEDVKFYLDTQPSRKGAVVALGPNCRGEIVARSFVEFVVLAGNDRLYI